MNKKEFTGIILEKIGKPNTEETIKRYQHVFWVDIRNNQNYRLTLNGFEACNQAQIRHYKFELSKINILPSLTAKNLLDMQKYVPYPFYLNEHSVFLFDQKSTVELMLYEGNFFKFIEFKKHSTKTA